MYLRLMLRGILRHRKKGRRLFILIALSAAGIIFLFTFKDSFDSGYRDLAIGAITGHLQIVSKDSPQLHPDQFVMREGLPLIEIDAQTEAFIGSLGGIEAAGKVIDTWATSYSLDGEAIDGFHIVGLPASQRPGLFPVATVLEGSDDIAWDPSMKDVPVARPRLMGEYGQVNPDHSVIKARELRVSGSELEAFKSRLASDFPTLFKGSYAGSAGDKVFFADWSAALKRSDLPSLVKPREGYEWKVDDALAALADNEDPARLPFLSKRLFKALYDEAIGPVPEPIMLDKPVTLQLPPPRTAGDTSIPVVVPAKYSGFLEVMPLYGTGASAFMELGALQHYMGLDREECLAYMIRLKDMADTPRIKGAIEAYLRDRGLPYVVADYELLGRLYKPTALALGVVCTILSIVLASIVVILVVNMVMLSVIKRRRELGTAIAIGMSATQNIVVMLGEVVVIVTASWLGGCVLGGAFVALGAVLGVPGMVFFPGNILHLQPQAGAFVLCLLLLAPASLLGAILPLLPLRKTMPVELLKEESR